MPTTKEAFLRYRIINECLLNKQRKFPSKNEIKETIMDRLGLDSFSDRAFEKDLHDMRFDEELGFLAPINYSKKERGYHYTKDDYSIDKIPLSSDELASIRAASQVFEQYQNIPFLSQVKGNINKLSDLLATTRGSQNSEPVIQFEEQLVTKGGQYLGELYQAIQDQNIVKINYQKFDSKKDKEHVVQPYLLKEFQGMWYLLAINKSAKNKWKTYALDRIVELEITEDYFVKEETETAQQFFANVIGISYSEEPTEKIKIKVSGALKNYISINPIHSSQVIKKESKDFIEIEVHVVPNPEFYAKICQYLPQVSIKSPKSVQKNFNKMLKEALDYQK